MFEDYCPLCQSHAIGRIGANLYYCRDCCVEIYETRAGWRAYHIDEEGGRTPVLESVAVWDGERKRNSG